MMIKRPDAGLFVYGLSEEIWAALIRGGILRKDMTIGEAKEALRELDRKYQSSKKVEVKEGASPQDAG